MAHAHLIKIKNTGELKTNNLIYSYLSRISTKNP